LLAVDKRMIESKFGGNFASLPGFSSHPELLALSEEVGTEVKAEKNEVMVIPS
jgi:hypothetical protein